MLALVTGAVAWVAPTSARAAPSSPPSEARADALATQRALMQRYEAEGKYPQAIAAQEPVVAALEEELEPDHPRVAEARLTLARLYIEQGWYGGAVSQASRALAVHESILDEEHPALAESLFVLGLAYKGQWAFERAEPLLERALTMRERLLGPEHAEVAVVMGNLGHMYREQGNLERAEQLLGRARDLAERALGPDHALVADQLLRIARIDYARGHYDRAEPAFQRCVAIFERALGPRHPRVGSTLVALSWLHLHRGDIGQSERLGARALSIFEDTLGPDHPLVADSLYVLVAVHWREGKEELAVAELRRILRIYEAAQGPNHESVLSAHKSLGIFLLELGRHDEALQRFERLLAIGDESLSRILTVADEGRRLAFASRFNPYTDLVLSAHLRATPRSRPMAALALTTLLRRKVLVQDLVAQSKAALLRSLPKEDRHVLDELEDVEARIAVLAGGDAGTSTLGGWVQRLDDLRVERDRLWSELAEHSALVEALNEPVTIEGVQEVLRAGEVLVELVKYVPQHDDAGAYVLAPHLPLPARYAAYVIRRDRFDWVDLGPAPPIDERVEAFRKAVQTRQVIPTGLYDAVMRPIVEQLGSAERLIIAPAGELSVIPFGALYDGEQYLIERYALRYVTTGRDLLASAADSPVTTNPITIVANPTGANLPDAELEADVLAGFFPDARVLRGDQATETNVRALERPLVLHMATHGFFGEPRSMRDDPMFRSGLVLADVAQVEVEVDRERDDGLLTAYEVSGMDLRGTELVVLSACETGLGGAARAEGIAVMSEGVAGLRRAFAMAGARSTVMSLWAVSGVTAQETMAGYYGKLSEGMGRGEAMQVVQMEMLRSEEHGHPKDWGAFVVSGDDGAVVFAVQEGLRRAKDEPPRTEGKGGCATPPSRRGVPTGSMLIGLLGLTTLRRRDQ